MNNHNSPIFIVGVPRSGTTLLAAMLAAHSRLSCGPETRFFRFLACTSQDKLYESWPENAVDFLFSTVLIDPVPDHYSLSRKQIQDYLQERTPSISVTLASLAEQFMWQEKKLRWIEKSPEHLLYVSAIRSHFPGSPIIRIVRDPRDVALSLTKTPWGPKDFPEALLLWHKYDEQSRNFFRTDTNCYTLHYEKLILSPIVELQQLCAFIGEVYEERMLNTSRSAANVITEKESWKSLVHRPVNEARVYVWKRELAEQQNHLAEALIGDRLITYGYECSNRFKHIAAVYPSLDKLLTHRESLQLLVEQDTRFWLRTNLERHGIQVYVGNPNQDGWLNPKKLARFLDVLRITTSILKGKLNSQTIYWIHDEIIDTKLGRCGRIIALIFRLVGTILVT